MMKKNNTSFNRTTINFGAGPACLPLVVLEEIRDKLTDWYGGMSILEISHRHSKVMEHLENIERDFRQVLNIPEDFAVLFLSGGARGQFSAVPLNLLQGAKEADYIITGFWSYLAQQEGGKYCSANVVASSEPQQYRTIPPFKSWQLSDKAAYFHYTENETIHGVAFQEVPQVDKWLISDMTSSLLTKPIDFTRFGLIYASAQKNLGIAGITPVIVRKTLLGEAHPLTPAIFNYQKFYETKSLYNTPPLFSWYVLGLMVKWVQNEGGCALFAKRNAQKAALIYDLIDSSDFYSNVVDKAYRSPVNIPFNLPNKALEEKFLFEAEENGLRQLKGHKLIGGCRASLFNAMPLEHVEILASFMADFEKRYG